MTHCWGGKVCEWHLVYLLRVHKTIRLNGLLGSTHIVNRELSKQTCLFLNSYHISVLLITKWYKVPSYILSHRPWQHYREAGITYQILYLKNKKLLCGFMSCLKFQAESSRVELSIWVQVGLLLSYQVLTSVRDVNFCFPTKSQNFLRYI